MKSGPQLGGEFIFDWLILIYEKLRLKFVFQILLSTNLIAVVNMKSIMKDVPLCIYWVKATGLLATVLETNVLLQTQPTLQTILEHKSPSVLQSFWLFSTKSWLEWLTPSFLIMLSSPLKRSIWFFLLLIDAVSFFNYFRLFIITHCSSIKMIKFSNQSHTT